MGKLFGLKSGTIKEFLNILKSSNDIKKSLDNKSKQNLVNVNNGYINTLYVNMLTDIDSKSKIKHDTKELVYNVLQRLEKLNTVKLPSDTLEIIVNNEEGYIYLLLKDVISNDPNTVFTIAFTKTLWYVYKVNKHTLKEKKSISSDTVAMFSGNRSDESALNELYNFLDSLSVIYLKNGNKKPKITFENVVNVVTLVGGIIFIIASAKDAMDNNRLDD